MWLDPKKDNFTQPLSAKEILDELEIFKDDYYRDFLISKNEDLDWIWKDNLILVLLIMSLMLFWKLGR